MTYSLRIKLLAFFLFMAYSSKLFEAANYGYLLAFLIALATVSARSQNTPIRIRFASTFGNITLGWVALTLLAIGINENTLRDILRDFGAVFAYFIGRLVIPRWANRESKKTILIILSDLGLLISIFTIFSALLAYRDGVDAYVWRGEYIPYSHSWLPYCLVASLAVAKLVPSEAKTRITISFICVAGTIASLSRTDMLLVTTLIAFMIVVNGRALLKFKYILPIICLGAFFVLSFPNILSLEVVQERINSGVSGNDSSVEWRLIENLALLDFMDQGGLLAQIFGYGWGARLPLPTGIYDFNERDSIPFLHNSYFTVLLKFGLLGLFILIFYAGKKLYQWHRMHKNHELDSAVSAGGWIFLFCLGKAVTLQGLTEWSHLVFFGIACHMLTRPASKCMPNTFAAFRTGS